MDYDNFLEGIAWTKREWHDIGKRIRLPWSSSYEGLRKRGDQYWLHLERMTETQLAKEVITGFLNTREWNCHVNRPNTLKGRGVVHNLKKAVDRLPPYYAAVETLTIEDADLEASAILKGVGHVPTILIIGEIYATLCDIKPRFGPVPASKLMHMALPNLFVMWDDAIINEYHVPCYPSTKPQYVTFLVLMQENVRHLRETHQKGSSMSNAEFVREINEQSGYRNLSMTRLLDIANYAVGHTKKGAPSVKCKLCYERANIKLGQLEPFIRQYPQFADTKLGRYRWS